MAERKNVVFVGMMQNGKSSLIQQILRYAGEHEQARTVGVGGGNFAETQVCSAYSLEAPLKHHMLREVVGSNDARRDRVVIPGEDFDFEDASELDLEEITKDNGDRLPLNLIDTPGLSDSNNKQSSRSGMCVIDERHKLRILLALQKIEDVHAICLVIRRDTSFSGDFQNLVKQLRDLFMFSVRSSSWNLNYHIVHTNIDPRDRSSDLCKTRQRAFDDFGPPGAIHHFIDNDPDPGSPLEQFLTNKALSNIFRSLLLHESEKFSNLRYPKSPKHEHNDQVLKNGIRLAIHQLRATIEATEKELSSRKKNIAADEPGIKPVKARLDEYDEKIAELNCDALSIIAAEDGWTGKNNFGGGSRLFSFNTTALIAEVDLWSDNDGNFVQKCKKEFSYSVTLRPNWACRALGSVTLKAKKKHKYADEIWAMRERRKPIAKEWDEFVENSGMVKQLDTAVKTDVERMERLVAQLQEDLVVVEQSGRSISLAANPGFVKYFTVDNPFSAAVGYQLQAKLPWTVPPLDQVDRDRLKELLNISLSAKRSLLDTLTAERRRMMSLFGQAQWLALVISQLVKPSFTMAQVQFAADLLHDLMRPVVNNNIEHESPELGPIAELMAQLERLRTNGQSQRSKDDDRAAVEATRSAEASSRALVTRLSGEIAQTLASLQEAYGDHTRAQAATNYLGSDEGVPVGIYALFIELAGKDLNVCFTNIYEQLSDVVDLQDLALD